MAYQTGTINSPSDLATLIGSFAAANGWAYDALTGVISKGGCYVKLGSSSTVITITGSKNGTFAGSDQCPRSSRIRDDAWPAVATYHIFAAADPDTIWCVMNFGTLYHYHIGFGMLQKYGSWTGGMWFHAQHPRDTAEGGAKCHAWIDGGTLVSNVGRSANCALFWDQKDYASWGAPFAAKVSYLHCEVRGDIWPTSYNSNDGSLANTILCPSIIGPLHKCNPNAFNGQTILTPFELYLQNTDGHNMALGHVGHLRHVKLTNYNPGDVIQIGSDRWKLFPWYQINASSPDGVQPGFGSDPSNTGVLGVAIKYDGP